MTQTLTAIFDGEVLHPDSPLDLTPNTHVVITIELPEKKTHFPLLSPTHCIRPEGPEYWVDHLEEYTYGGID